MFEVTQCRSSWTRGFEALRCAGWSICRPPGEQTRSDQAWLGKIARAVGALCVSGVLLLVLGSGMAKAQAGNIYVAQNAAGSANGSSCANAYAYGFFSTAGNWGTGSNQIGPGTTVNICGTITDSLNGTLLTAHGSGASGNPVTIKLQLNASLQSPGENQFINGNGQSHFVITGVTACGWVSQAEVPCTESIYNTLNGFSGQTCPGGSCANQVGTTAIGGFASDLTVENLTIGPIYIHGGTSDVTFSAPGPVGISSTGSASVLTVHNVIIHDGGWCMNAIVPNLTMYNFELYHCDHGNGGGQYTDTPNTVSNILIHDGYIHDPSVWDQANNAFHHDGIHLFSYCGTNVGGNNTFCPNTIITGVNIYNMRFGGNWGSNNTANIFFEGNVTNANIFNNVSIATNGPLNNGFFNGYGSNIHFFNNTALGSGGSTQVYKILGDFNGPGIVIENNVATDAAPLADEGPWPVGGASGCPYALPSAAGGGTQNCVNLSYTVVTNAYLAPGQFSNGFGYGACVGASCTGNGFLNFNSSGFASFESGVGGTPKDIFDDTVEPNGTYLNAITGAEISGSPTIGAGTNLTSLCTGLGVTGNPCLFDTAGNARPSSGAWDIGAYQYQAVALTPPVAPTSLIATAH